MKVLKIKQNSITVVMNDNSNGVVARYNDEDGSYFFNEELNKEYCLDKEGSFVGDATYFCGIEY